MKTLNTLPGLLLCACIAIISSLLATYIPLGAVSIAIILGIILGNTIKLKESVNSGIAFSEKHLLAIAIALMGLKLNFLVLQELGFKTILFIICALCITISSALLLAKICGCDTKCALLVGIGNGVCGSSAIAATEKIIGADKEVVGLSIAVVNFLGTIGIFLVPAIAHFIMGFSEVNSGILAGNTLQAVGQVVAAGFSIGDEAGHVATIVKMTRILMLVPLFFILIPIFANKNKSDSKGKFKMPAIPIFIIGFVVLSMVPTFHLLNQNTIGFFSSISHYLLVIAMAGIGLKIKMQSILTSGKATLGMASIIFAIQIAFSCIILMSFYR